MNESAITGEHPIRFCREKEIAFGQALNLMRPNFHLALAPCQKQIRMMALVFRNRPDFVHKFESLSKILEFVGPFKVAF